VAADHSTPSFTSLADLASARVGGRALAASDDFFASKHNLLKAAPAIFIPGKYTARGKWMDGWESRRRRTPGHDWCVVRLGMRGRVRGIVVDTAFFTGNYPSHCSLDALDGGGQAVNRESRLTRGGQAVNRESRLTRRGQAVNRESRLSRHGGGPPWTRILEQTPLRGDAANYIVVADERAWTHLRLNIYPDGGVARLRVHGDVVVDWPRVAPGRRLVDLAAIEHGGLVLAASDMHYGAKDNIIMPGRAANMGDGWETRRRRGPGHDWLLLRLGAAGHVRKIEIDTNHFKGNYPDAASIEGCLAPGATVTELASAIWMEMLPATKLRASHRHYFDRTLRSVGPVSHLRLNIYPDGGVSRLRVHGTLARD
jgi:allantoicase